MTYIQFEEMQNVPTVILKPSDYDALIERLNTPEYSDGIYAGFFYQGAGGLVFFCKDLKG